MRDACQGHVPHVAVRAVSGGGSGGGWRASHCVSVCHVCGMGEREGGVGGEEAEGRDGGKRATTGFRDYEQPRQTQTHVIIAAAQALYVVD